MTPRSEVFSVARERVADLFEDLTGHTDGAVDDMVAIGVADEDLADTDKVRSTVLKAWKYSLNRAVELERREESTRWADLFDVFALIMAELEGQRPTPREFVDVIADYTGWPEGDRVSLTEHITGVMSTSSGEVNAGDETDEIPGEVESGGESGAVVTAASEQVGSELVSDTGAPAPESALKKAPPKSAPRRQSKRKKLAKPKGPRIEVGPMSNNKGQSKEQPLIGGDLDYRVTGAGQTKDEYLIEGRITVNNPHAHQNVRGVGSYAAEKASAEIEAGLRARGAEVAAAGIGRGAAVTAALIAILGLDEDGLVELSPAMTMAVEILREARQTRAGVHLNEMGEETRRTRASVEELGVMMAKLLESSEVNGRLVATVVADRSGIAPIPVTRDPEDIEVLGHGARQVYDQAGADVRDRIDGKVARQWRSRKGAAAVKGDL